jgi:hypothetical protein
LQTALEAAIEDAREKAASHEEQATYWLKRAEDTKANLLARHGDVLGGKLPSPREVEVSREYGWPTLSELEARLPELRDLWASNGGSTTHEQQRKFEWWIYRWNQFQYHRLRQKATGRS